MASSVDRVLRDEIFFVFLEASSRFVKTEFRPKTSINTQNLLPLPIAKHMMETLKRSFSDALLEVDIMNQHNRAWPVDNDCSPRKLVKKGPQEDNVQIQNQFPNPSPVNMRKRRIETCGESSDEEDDKDIDNLFDTSLRKRAKVHEMEELDHFFGEKLSLDLPPTSKALVLQRTAVAKETNTPRYESIYLTVEDVTHAALRDGRDDQHPSLFGPFSIPPNSGQLIKYDGKIKPHSIEEVDDQKESQDASLMEIIEFLD